LYSITLHAVFITFSRISFPIPLLNTFLITPLYSYCPHHQFHISQLPNPTANHTFVRCCQYDHKTVLSYKLQYSTSLSSSKTSHVDGPSHVLHGTFNGSLQNLISVPSVTSHTLLTPLHTKPIQIDKNIFHIQL